MRRALDGIGKSRRLAVLRSVDGVSALQQRRELVRDIYASRVGCRGAGHEQAEEMSWAGCPRARMGRY